MNLYELSIVGINVADGIKRFNGNAAMYEKYVRRFAEDENYDLLCRAISQKNVKEAFNAAHTLKGVAGNLSIAKIYQDIVPLVEELRVGSLAHAEELLAKVSCDYETIVSALRD